MAMIFTLLPGDYALASPIAMDNGCPISPEILSQIDQRIDELWPVLTKAQTEYFAMTGRYYQALWSHSTPPSIVSAKYPDGWYTHPTDQQYRWSDISIIKFEEMPYQMKIDVYDGPEGAGYVASYRFQEKDYVCEKSRNTGPEALKGSDWLLVMDDKAGISP